MSFESVKFVKGGAFQHCKEMNRLECYECTAVAQDVMYGTKLQSARMSLEGGKQVWAANDSDSKENPGSKENS